MRLHLVPLCRVGSSHRFGAGAPEESGIEHVVVVTIENRSFGHFLGWLPGADGLLPGLMYADRKDVSHSPRPLAPDFTGCPHPSPDHSGDQSRVAYNDGKMDGFLRAGSDDEYTIGYYTQADLPRLQRACSELLGVRPLFRLDPRADFSEPPVSMGCPD